MLDNVYGHIKTTEYTETNVNKVTGNDIKNSSFITTLNNNITDQSWRKWKVGENGYPVFEQLIILLLVLKSEENVKHCIKLKIEFRKVRAP